MSASERFAPRLSLAAGLSSAPSSLSPRVRAPAEPAPRHQAPRLPHRQSPRRRRRRPRPTPVARATAATTTGRPRLPRPHRRRPAARPTRSPSPPQPRLTLTGEDEDAVHRSRPTPRTRPIATTARAPTNWPALFVETRTRSRPVLGVTGALTTITQADGKKQAAYNGAPALLFVGRQARPATPTARASPDKWYVAAP